MRRISEAVNPGTHTWYSPPMKKTFRVGLGFQLAGRFADVSPGASDQFDRHRIGHLVPLLRHGGANPGEVAIMHPEPRGVLLELLNPWANRTVGEGPGLQELPPRADPSPASDRLRPFEQLRAGVEPGRDFGTPSHEGACGIGVGDDRESGWARRIQTRPCAMSRKARLG